MRIEIFINNLLKEVKSASIGINKPNKSKIVLSTSKLDKNR